eukprot:TRINITY_DN1386_c0_g1_i1.p2 TRINITY_DN1386_c0_g1~~TRINITY_DN1386_c0_g1_i1.p2  ORF type:complete len:129 (-),score=11.33 TRINITY_DN1386_c0_g1_i1:2390-2776(-)
MLSVVARNHMGSFNLSFSLESCGDFSNKLKHQKKIIRNTKKEMVKVTARMSSRILTIATTVLKVKKPVARVNAKLNSDVRTELEETEVENGIFWFGFTSMTGNSQYLLFTRRLASESAIISSGTTILI